MGGRAERDCWQEALSWSADVCALRLLRGPGFAFITRTQAPRRRRSLDIPAHPLPPQGFVKCRECAGTEALALFILACSVLGEAVRLPESQFPHLQSGDINRTHFRIVLGEMQSAGSLNTVALVGSPVCPADPGVIWLEAWGCHHGVRSQVLRRNCRTEIRGAILSCSLIHPPTHSPTHSSRIPCLPVTAPFPGHGRELEPVPTLHRPNTRNQLQGKVCCAGGRAGCQGRGGVPSSWGRGEEVGEQGTQTRIHGERGCELGQEDP